MFRALFFLSIAGALLATTVLIWRRGRRRHDRRMRVALVLRSLVLLLFVFALAEPYRQTLRARIAVVQLIDVSASVAEAGRIPAHETATRYLSALPRDAEVATVLFASQPLVLRGFGPPSEHLPERLAEGVAKAPIPRNATDIASALTFAANLLRPSGDRRILLTTDGAETAGRAEEVTARLRAEGIPVDLVPIEPPSRFDVRALQLRLPPRARRGETIEGRLTILSDRPASGMLRVLLDGRIAEERPVTIESGQRTIAFPVRMDGEGEAEVIVSLLVQGDTRRENNTAAAFVRVGGTVRALYVQGSPEGATAAESALRRREGIRWEQVTPSELPPTAERLTPYDAIVFEDVPANDLTDAQRRAIAAYVQEGGGWLLIGGPHTFGAGNWQDTPLEEAAPIKMIPQDREKPLALVLLLDKSGSMAHESGGLSKLTLAASATRSALGALGSRDRIAIIAFDAKAKTIVSFRPKSERGAILHAVESLRPGSGTDIGAALERAGKLLAKIDLPRRQVLLLSDGQSEGDLAGIARRLAAQKITVATIAVGVDAQPVMQTIATAGGGSYYALEDLSRLPQIFAEEARNEGDVLVQKKTAVRVVAETTATRGTFPPLDGYIAATPKPAARTLLETAEGDPILVEWRYGLGRALAFLSDGGNRWARTWTEQDNFAARWETWLRRVRRHEASETFDLLAETQGSTLVVRAAFPSEARPEDPPLLRVRTPNGTVRETTLQRSEEGFTARLPLDGAGTYDVAVSTTSGESATRKVVFLDNAETLVPPNPALLRRLADATGGSVLPEPAAWAQPKREGIPREQRLAGPLLLAALVLALLEWCVRQWAPTRKSMPSLEHERPFSRLKTAKVRLRAPKNLRRAVSSVDRHDVPTAGEGLHRLKAAKARVGF